MVQADRRRSVVVALPDDHGVAIAMIAPFAHHFAFANDVAVAVAFADRYAGRAHTHTNFIRTCRQRGSDERGRRDNC
jgi:hypothetical protein